MSYYGSTRPESVGGTSGVDNYTDFDGVNSPLYTSTGTVTFSGTNSFTGTNNFTGTNKQYFVGSSSNAIAGNSVSTGTTANIPIKGVQWLIPSGSSTPFYRLETPTVGAEVTLYGLASNTSHPVYVYSSQTTSLTVPFANVGGGVFTTSNNLLTLRRGSMVSLLGASTTKWIVVSSATFGSTEANAFSSST